VESFARSGDGVRTRGKVLPFGCAREQVDEKEIILHGCVGLSLNLSASLVPSFAELVRFNEL